MSNSLSISNNVSISDGHQSQFYPKIKKSVHRLHVTVLILLVFLSQVDEVSRLVGFDKIEALFDMIVCEEIATEWFTLVPFHVMVWLLIFRCAIHSYDSFTK